MKTCVYVRCVNESHFLNAFFEHYINLGFDMIYVLYCEDNDNYVIPERYIHFVTIKKVYNIGNSLFDHHKSIIDRDKYNWVFITDLDEFLILQHRFLNITELINEYQLKNGKVNTIQFPWAWSHKFSVSSETVQDIFLNRKKYIGRLGAGKEIWYKSMVKTKNMGIIGVHSTQLINIDKQVIGYNGKIDCIRIDNQPEDKQTWTIWGDSKGLRKHDVESGVYSDALLLHITTRNIIDTYFKTLEKQARPEKKMNNKDEVLKILNKLEHGPLTENLIIQFIQNFGYRIEFPFKTTQFGDLDQDEILKHFREPNSRLPLYSELKTPKNISKKPFIKIGKELDLYFS